MAKPSTRPEQLEVAGAAPLSGMEMAKRRARYPLRPSIAQQPCDVGLFGDGANQLDLVDLARKQLAADLEKMRRG